MCKVSTSNEVINRGWICVDKAKCAMATEILPHGSDKGFVSECHGADGGHEEAEEDEVPSAGGSLACLVFIHGESYEWNSAAPYDGTALAANAKIIVVTINFRLGVLGFLKTGAKNSAQGNFGIMDLVAGLHWLRENLPAFGGDPERVTLMGHGTGAALANFLAVSPVAKELLKRVILLSGSGLSSWALQREPLTIKRKVAEQTGCHGDLVEDDIAPCLRALPLAKLLEVRADAPRFLPGFAPFVDGTVLPHPDQAHQPSMSSSGGGAAAVASASGHEFANFPHRDLMFGLTSIESYLELNAQDLEFGFNETRRDRILRTFVRNAFYYHLNEIYSTLKNEYTDWDKPVQNPLNVRDATLEVLSDGQTAAPLIRLGYLHALRGGSTYFAHFQHLSSDQDYPQRGGSVNGEELSYWLALPLAASPEHNYTQHDRNVAAILVRYVSNFVNHGNPNDPKSTKAAQQYSTNSELQTTDEQLPFWDTYDTINQLYLEMNNNPEMRSHYRGHKMSLWLSLIPQLHRPGAEVPDASMRHHHFQEEGASYYEGAVRPQSMHRPNIPHLNVGVLSNVGDGGGARTSSTRTPPVAPAPPPQRPVIAPTTDCPPNNTRESPDDALLRRLASSHYHSYTAALSVTIAVGCFLLLLNVLIFAGIYHQRGGRRDSKDDLAEAGSCSSSSAEHYDVKALEMETRAFDAERKAGAFLAATAFDLDTTRPSFGEYSCYDEKHQRSLPDVSVARVDPRDFRRSPRPRRADFGSAARLDAQTPDIQRTDSQSVRSFERANSFRECRREPASIVGKTSTFCEPQPLPPRPPSRGIDCSTQVKFGPPAPRRVDSPGERDGSGGTGTISVVTTSEAACGPDEAAPPPATSTAPGILRQATNPVGIVKKRVQIQEISV